MLRGSYFLFRDAENLQRLQIVLDFRVRVVVILLGIQLWDLICRAGQQQEQVVMVVVVLLAYFGALEVISSSKPVVCRPEEDGTWLPQEKVIQTRPCLRR